MQIENLDLNDFGCFNRARIEDIDEGLTIIAGPQRAGKTTFMQAVRRLGYGISKGESLPPATDNYDIDADVNVSGHQYTVSLDGYAAPKLTPLDGGPERDMSEIYGLGKTQYQQLYTISLAELRADPPTLENGETDLTSVLLGAYGDIRDVPEIRDALKSDAKDIGGKHGRDVYQLGNPMETIEEGLRAKDEALQQVDEYEQKDAEHERVEAKIGDIDEEEDELTDEEARLKTVVANHETYTEIQELENQLSGENETKLDSFPLAKTSKAESILEDWSETHDRLEDARRAFTSTTNADEPSQHCDRLLAAQNDLEFFQEQLAGWQEQVRTISEKREKLSEEKESLQQQAQSLHPDWDGTLERVASADTDLFSADEITATVSTIQDTKKQLASVERDIEEFEQRHTALSQKIDTADAAQQKPTISDHRMTAGLAVGLSIIAGSGAGIITGPIPGVIVTSLILVAAGAYISSKIDSQSEENSQVNIENLRSDKRSVKADLDGKRERKQMLDEQLNEAQKDLHQIQNEFDLPETASADVIESFFEGLTAMQTDIKDFRQSKQKLREEEQELEEDLSTVITTLSEMEILQEDIDREIEAADRLFSTIESSKQMLEAATEFDEAQQAVDVLKTDAKDVLQAWDDCPNWEESDPESIREALDAFTTRAEEIEALLEARNNLESALDVFDAQLSAESELFEPYRTEQDVDDDWLLDAYRRILDEYDGIERVKKRIAEIEERLDELDSEREECVEKKVELEQHMESLASDDDIHEAHRQIEKGQKELEPLAERYATLRVGQYLLDELHEQYVDRITGPLLDEASDIFERLTDGTYTEVDSENEFGDLDFKATLADGNGIGAHATNQLSRATREQLFLSVRLARIKQHDESLPVLLDDSLTNFDPMHIDRTIEVISELAATNQIFLLTCHPTLVDRIEAVADADYWCLESGSFQRGNSETAREILTNSH